MAQAEHSTTAQLPIETIWAFVEEMDNWAHMLTGYQEHVKQSETESLWTLKGDVGVLARVVQFRVKITEWAGPERVAFQLEGVNEPMSGEGEFRMEATGSTPGALAPTAAKPGLLARLLRWLFRWRHGAPVRAETGGDGPGTRLTFRLQVQPGGPMAPMVNALVQPAMLPFAEDLAEKILAHLEAGAEARRDAASRGA